MEPICYIIGAGETCEMDFKEIQNRKKDDMLIAADGGYSTLFAQGLTPDLIIGDFDSCKIDIGSIPSSIPLIKLTPEKDYTDVHTCIEEGISRGFRNFRLYGCTGGRISHTIANIQLMTWLAQKEITATMLGLREIFYVIHNRSLSLSGRENGYISIFSLTNQAEQVTLSGLKYSLDNAPLTNTFPLGVSNEFIGTNATICVTNGTLLIICER